MFVRIFCDVKLLNIICYANSIILLKKCLNFE
nr:MAG TPA: hypothetical protein [Caudoviricetes sp.]